MPCRLLKYPVRHDMEIELIRTYLKAGVNGVLIFEGIELCKTIELPWRANVPRISCIPEGRYQVLKRYSPKFKWHFELMAVPGRKYILIHPANDAQKELKGCIAPVLCQTGEGKGSSSRLALERLKNHLYPLLEKEYVLTLTIKKSIL